MPTRKHRTLATNIALDAREEFIYNAHTSCERVRGAEQGRPYKVYLQIGVQRFTIGEIPSEDAKHADWVRRVLAKALNRIHTANSAQVHT